MNPKTRHALTAQLSQHLCIYSACIMLYVQYSKVHTHIYTDTHTYGLMLTISLPGNETKLSRKEDWARP